MLAHLKIVPKMGNEPFLWGLQTGRWPKLGSMHFWPKNRNIFGVVQIVKFKPLAYWWYALLTNIAIPKQKNWLLSQISQFSGQNCTFSSLADNLSRTGKCYQHGKGVSSVSWYEDTKSFTPSPQKMDFWPKNGQICPKTGILGQISAFLAHLI